MCLHRWCVGLGIRYQTNGKLFNLRRLHEKSKIMQALSETFCFLMTMPSMLVQKLTCNVALTHSLMFTQTSALQSVLRRLKYCISQHQENHMLSPSSQTLVKTVYSEQGHLFWQHTAPECCHQ